MRKVIAASAAGLMLVASQAAAAGANTPAVGDRIGADASESSEFAGLPLPVLLIGAAVIVGTVVVATDDDSESD